MLWTMEEQRAPPTTATQLPYLTLPRRCYVLDDGRAACSANDRYMAYLTYLAELWSTADSVSSPSTVAQLRYLPTVPR